MTSQAVPGRTRSLEHRRFKVRFLGRPATWLWLAATGLGSGAAWFLVALPARGLASSQRTWYLWSGNVLLALFLLTMLFVARKWSIRLKFFRDFGRVPEERGDSCWSAIQGLNSKIRKGAYGSDEQIVIAADEIIRRFGTQKVQRAELLTEDVGGKRVQSIRLKKKEAFGRLEKWLEMHMGVGTIACLAVLLHADSVLPHSAVGWALLIGSMLVLITGLVGAVLYRIVPEKLSKADVGIPYEEAGIARENYQICIDGMLAAVDEKLRVELTPLAAPVANAQEAAARATSVMGRIALQQPENAELARDVIVMAGSRDQILWSTAQARRYDLWLRLWRWIHVPVSAALFFVIALHVWAVLWY